METIGGIPVAPPPTEGVVTAPLHAPGVGDPIEEIEIEALLEGVYRKYGYDFREYARSSLRRRIRQSVRAEGLASVSALQERVLRDAAWLERFLFGLSVTVSAMFRDPGFYGAFRERVVPLLRTYPFIRIWHAGCSTGEEVYSMAILLSEEGLYDRCRIYATDMNEAVLKRAREGIFPLAQMKTFTANYQQAGGQRAFSEYYTARYDSAIFRANLKNNLVFAQHNLVTDGPFNEFHVILCRNVMIYFNPALQARVHELLYTSLVRFGFLGLGSKESLKYMPHESCYAELDPLERLYRRVR
jgi:chemotaxis protein methyltransferase CheR